MENIQNTLYGKMWPGLFQAIKEKISAGSWKKSQKATFQCLKVENGQMPEWLELREQGGAVQCTAWRLLDAQFWGVPQRRKRIYLVSDFGNGRAGQILFECESVLGYHPQGGEQTKGNSDYIESGVTGTDCRGMAEDASGQMTLECERLDGFPDEWTRYGASGKEMSDNARYMALGNSIAVPCAERVFIGINKAESEENEA